MCPNQSHRAIQGLSVKALFYVGFAHAPMKAMKTKTSPAMTIHQGQRMVRRSSGRLNLSSRVPMAKKAITDKKDMVYTPARASTLPSRMRIRLVATCGGGEGKGRGWR